MNSPATNPARQFVLPALVLSLALVLVLYHEVTRYVFELWLKWEDGGYGHGFVVLLISASIVIGRRHLLRAVELRPAFNALPAVACCSLVWLLAAIADVLYIQVAVLLPMLLAIIWALGGWRLMRLLLFPVAYLGFALPLWDPLIPLLQDLTAVTAYALTRVAGIPATMDGYLLTLPAGRLSVEPVCSGLHYLLAALALGCYYGYLHYRSRGARLLVVVIAGLTAIVANIARVFIVIVLAYVTDMQHPLISDHFMLGWYLFGGIAALLFLLDFRLNRHAGVATAADAASVIPDARDDGGQPVMPVVALLVLLLAVAGPGASWWLDQQPVAGLPAKHAMPAGIGGWHGPDVYPDSWTPVFHGAIGLRARYGKQGDIVHVYTGLYDRQAQGRELVNHLNSLDNPDDWRLFDSHGKQRRVGDFAVMERKMVSFLGERRLVWYIYRVAGRFSVDNYLTKFHQVVGILSGNQRAGVIVLAAEYGNDADEARHVLSDFTDGMLPALAEFIDT